MNKRHPSDYGSFLKDVVGKVNAYLASEEKSDAVQIRLYWSIGEAICARSERSAAVVLSEELARVFPEEKGFSPRNVRRMREFYRTYVDCPILAAYAFEIGWTSNVLIMEHCASPEEQDAYLRAVRRTGWSKAELLHSFDDPALLKEVTSELMTADEPRKRPVSAMGAVSYEESPEPPNTPCAAAVPACGPAVTTPPLGRVPQHEKAVMRAGRFKAEPLRTFDAPNPIKSASAGKPCKQSVSAKRESACGPAVTMLPQSHGQERKTQQEEKEPRQQLLRVLRTIPVQRESLCPGTYCTNIQWLCLAVPCGAIRANGDDVAYESLTPSPEGQREKVAGEPPQRSTRNGPRVGAVSLPNGLSPHSVQRQDTAAPFQKVGVGFPWGSTGHIQLLRSGGGSGWADACHSRQKHFQAVAMKPSLSVNLGLRCSA